MLDDEQVAPMAACALGQLLGQSDRWPPMDRSDELVELVPPSQDFPYRITTRARADRRRPRVTS
jgi:hypothetical protein